jgi:mannose PTS system EIID component
MSAPETGTPKLPLRTRLATLTRLLAVQGSWNYELMLGTGIGFCAEPALRELRGGRDGTAYHEALARQSRYFNAHPYLASIAVGALVRAELDGQPPQQIERFRIALCGPLGSLGDRLVWAGWLPFSALLALLAFGLGAGAGVVVLLFLAVYNVGHIGLRAWGLRVGWRHGLRVATALGHPMLRRGPLYIGRGVMFLSGVALPLAVRRVLEGTRSVFQAPAAAVHGSLDIRWLALLTLGAAAMLALLLARLHGRVEGWRVALLVLAALVTYSLTR